jgi:CDP-paratose 2-epimerase
MMTDIDGSVEIVMTGNSTYSSFILKAEFDNRLDQMKVLISGSAGLIGSELAQFFDAGGHAVHGFDNDMRADFFGPRGSTAANLDRLRKTTRNYRHAELDVRDAGGVARLVSDAGPFDLIVHCAAQPSHDLSALRPRDDFDVNAGGTLNMLEAARISSPEAVFVTMSSNKVYGDAPNEIPMVELETRYDYADPADYEGVNESLRIDDSRHSIFGAGKVAADVLTQEYGRTFGMRTHCLRGGCLTGPNQQGVEMHGFLSYLVKTQLERRTYRIYGFKGKQVRDNIHSHDVALAIDAIARKPGIGEVYNIGGGRENSCSILEAFARVESLTGLPMQFEYVDKPRDGDHQCYITDLSRFRSAHPEWEITRSLDSIFSELVTAWQASVGG